MVAFVSAYTSVTSNVYSIVVCAYIQQEWFAYLLPAAGSVLDSISRFHLNLLSDGDAVLGVGVGAG